MPDGQTEPPAFPADEAARGAYQAIVDGARRTGPRGNLLFLVSTADLSQGRGDLYVALGLARGLADAGWGVSLWPTERMTEETPDDIDVAIVMVESFVPGLVHERTQVVAWVRNWTESWAALPYLGEFAQIWCSSTPSAERIRSVYDGPVHVVPLATDPQLFAPRGVARDEEVVTTANYWGVPRGLTDALQSLSVRARVTWFGANSRHLQLDAPIDHRDAVDYFSLPWVYSSWLIVVDDVIEAAAAYGNQNSRLFDALACGAVVITNTSLGLDELGLAEVPVYADPAGLRELVEGMLADPAATAERAARLADVVATRHGYPARAAQLTPVLSDLVARAVPHPRSELLRWATLQREELRRAETEVATWRTHYHDASEELVRVHRELERIRSSRSFRAARMMTGPIRAVRPVRRPDPGP